jgi:hypothetical protein
MSVYKRCSQAVRELAQGSDLFTELDVIDRASENSWTEEEYRKAMTQANQIAYAYYRSGRLTRFGPVEYNGEQDYVRRASKIVYAGLKTGPTCIESPNGQFPRLMVFNDEIASVGRRSGTNRDDLRAWPQTDNETLQRQIEQLSQRVRHLEKEAVTAS